MKPELLASAAPAATQQPRHTTPPALRKAIRRPRVLEATGWSVPTLYRKMNVEKVFPKSQKLDPKGQAVIWWEDEVAAWQRGEWKATEVAA